MENSSYKRERLEEIFRNFSQKVILIPWETSDFKELRPVLIPTND